MYHDVSNYLSPWCISPEVFEEHLQYLSKEEYSTITLDELQEGIEQQKETSKKLVVITFDDGRRGVLDHAAPLLRRYRFNATLFIVPSWIDGQNIPSTEQYSPFLTWDNLKKLQQAGMIIGSHTNSHQNLTSLSSEEIEKELIQAELKIKEKLSLQVKHFSYPYGKYNELVIKTVRERYQTATTATRGFSKEPYLWSRQWVLSTTNFSQFKKLLHKPTLSVCMIVKNEEATLAHSLDSIKSIASQIIIVDTGSSDQTKEIAKTYTSDVYDFTWQDDFALARNESLRYATADWVLVLDADEIISSSDLVLVDEAINNWGVMGYRILTRNYTNDSSILGWQPSGVRDAPFSAAQGWFPSIKVRLFQNHNHFSFIGQVHELIDQSIADKSGQIENLRISVHHDSTIVKNVDKTKHHLELTKKKIMSDPTQAKSYVEMGIQYKELGDFTLAQNAFREALKLGSTSLSLFINLGIVQHKQGLFEEAICTYQAALAIYPSSSNAYFGLGFCYSQKKEWDKALENFLKAVECNEKHLDAYINIGALYEKQGRYELALQNLRKAIAISPNSRCYYNLGVVYERVGDLALSLYCYQKALEGGYFRKEFLEERIQKMKETLNSEVTQTDS